MGKQSAGILLYRTKLTQPQVFLVHPGGPFYKNKDLGAWSIPKGEYSNDEAPLAAAKREFEEETGSKINGEFIPLHPIVLKSGKKVMAWAVKGDIDQEKLISNVFEIEWPPKSGKKQSFPEVDRGEWFGLDEARTKVNPAQVRLIDELEGKVR